MEAQLVNHKIKHWAIRFIVLVNLLLLLLFFLDFAFPSNYYDFVQRPGLFDAWPIWYIASPLILIVMAGLGTWWMRGNETERRGLAVDWFFVLTYICAWVISFFYPIALA
jgi:hypothetical protein